MDILSNFFNFFIFTFTTIASFHGVFLFKMIISLKIKKNPNPFPLAKIGASTLHFLPHLLIQFHFMHLKKLKMHS